MGLKYGYDNVKRKWYVTGLYFIKYYDTKEEMEDNLYADTLTYFERLKNMKAFTMVLAKLR